MGNLKCTILAIFTSGSVAPYTLTPLCSRPALTGTSCSETQSRLNATVLLSRPPGPGPVSVHLAASGTSGKWSHCVNVLLCPLCHRHDVFKSELVLLPLF